MGKQATDYTAVTTLADSDVGYYQSSDGLTDKPIAVSDQRRQLASTVGVSAQTISFTFALTDAGGLVTISNAGATTATIPKNSVVAFPINTILYLKQIGAGACTWTPVDGTVTINYDTNTYASLVTAGQYRTSYAIKTATDTWVVEGGITPLNPLKYEHIPISAVGSDAAATTGVNYWDVPADGTLSGIGGGAGVAPTGSAAVIDANLQTTPSSSGGTTIMTTNKISISAAAYQDDGTAALTTTAVSQGNRIWFDIDSVGSTVAGQAYYVGITWRPS